MLPRALAAVGRMALTAYLGTTLICVLIFDGWGAGQFGSWSHAETWRLTSWIWLFWLIAASAWFSFFRFGPMEWLWRSLTFLRPQPMRERG
ncbi:MAG: hypothetical protein CMJ94_14615 [Planctomycetes bacterium]|nr:hypothetical protein [Planctomycetota bacterium]